MATGVFFCSALKIHSSYCNEIARAHTRHTKEDFLRSSGNPMWQILRSTAEQVWAHDEKWRISWLEAVRQGQMDVWEAHLLRWLHLLIVVWCLLFVVGCLLFAVCCSLFAVLLGAWCFLFCVCCCCQSSSTFLQKLSSKSNNATRESRQRKSKHICGNGCLLLSRAQDQSIRLQWDCEGTR